MRSAGRAWSAAHGQDVATIPLTRDLVMRHRWSPKPIGSDDKARIVFEDTSGRERYVVHVAADSVPLGFAVRVGARKTFIPRRKVNGKSVQPTVGNVADFPERAAARAKAAKFAGQLTLRRAPVAVAGDSIVWLRSRCSLARYGRATIYSTVASGTRRSSRTACDTPSNAECRKMAAMAAKQGHSIGR